MRLQGKRIGFALTGSLCTVEVVLKEMERIVEEGALVWPILSNVVSSVDSKYGKASEWVEKVRRITGQEPLTTLVSVEPIGPQNLFDVIVVAPCTGNTLAKIANAITDGPVTMAVKAHLRNQRPVVIAVSTNDGLGLNAKNLGILLAAKNVYFVPFGQDNPYAKPNSLNAKYELMVDTIVEALNGRQIQPLLIGAHKE
ncbi:MAG TPA: dipicolinate synthase subunit B [Clostridia bacterium]|nr:dipicolinate synthase subunit B [Clostridia bacterium]